MSSQGTYFKGRVANIHFKASMKINRLMGELEQAAFRSDEAATIDIERELLDTIQKLGGNLRMMVNLWGDPRPTSERLQYK